MNFSTNGEFISQKKNVFLHDFNFIQSIYCPFIGGAVENSTATFNNLKINFSKKLYELAQIEENYNVSGFVKF